MAVNREFSEGEEGERERLKKTRGQFNVKKGGKERVAEEKKSCLGNHLGIAAPLVWERGKTRPRRDQKIF